MTGGSEVTTSFCPVLGKKNGEEYKGFCPSHVQEPFGKTLNVSFIGAAPYVVYNPVGGSEFDVMKILAKKFGFIPKFIAAKSFDANMKNKTTYSMVHQVNFHCKSLYSTYTS